jgi:RHS repeat-associated protein
VTAQDRDKYATYYRDSTTGLDYAQNRYYASTLARFTSPDPYMASGGPTDPQSWNQYAYTRGDPVNRFDPAGLQDCTPKADGSFNCGSVTGTASPGNVPLDPGPNGGPQSSQPVGPQTPGSRPDPRLTTPTMLQNAGLANAQRGLGMIWFGAWESKGPCDDFFAALVQENHLDIDAATLMAEVVGVAKTGAYNGNVYDGPSSATPLNSVNFPGTSAPGGTVGSYFAQNYNNVALSQFNGAAIFIRQSDWSGWFSPFASGSTPNQLGLGTLLHEILHKQAVGGGFGHDQLTNALNAIGAPPARLGQSGTQAISGRLGSICF